MDEPWSVAPIEDGTYLVTEKSGRLVRLEPNGNITPITGTPPVYFASQGGLLEVLADTDFASNRMIYLSFAGGDKSANRTTVVKAKLDGDKLREIQTILEVGPDKEGPAHYGGKLAFLPDGTLLVTVGEGYRYR
ncbi:MAG: PQQ-dependent sugar dehydrogenase, partial [Pseudomonadota bacterium]|nr:PQQ-dependent sugar dehydrogenase [Pseudomonadota bacterium]